MSATTNGVLAHASSDLKTAPAITMTAPPNTTPSVEETTVALESSTLEPEGMFGAELISPAIAASLPPTYTLRALRKSDYDIGFLDVLRVLTTVGDITKEEWNGRYDWMNTQGKGGYYLLVIEDQGRIVGTGALLVERKLWVSPLRSLSQCLRRLIRHCSIHHLGIVGHIEDIAVAKDQQGKKLGLKLIQALDFIAEKVGCYKCILDCSEANEGFYVKCGYKRAGLEMAHYYNRDANKETSGKPS
jgi:glucosamine-phosphate N-acetyltransferase